MSNEEMVKLVKMLDALGYRVVSINTLSYIIDSLGNREDNGKFDIVIAPAENTSR